MYLYLYKNIYYLFIFIGLSATNLQVTTSQNGVSEFIMSCLMSQSQSAEDGTLGILKCTLSTEVKSGEFYGCTDGFGWMRGIPKLLKPEPICTAQDSKDLLWSKSEEAIGDKFII